MDLIKFGSFLSQLRHEHGLTQEQLGAHLGVTNKTISRWENGNYLPPVEMLLILSQFFDVSINELLSGERLSTQDYKDKAEENLTQVLRSSAFTVKERVAFFQKKWKKEHTFELIFEMLMIAILLIVGFVLDNGLQVVAVFLVFVWNIIQYNRMMGYVEQRAYTATGE